MLKFPKLKFIPSEHLSTGNIGWSAISSALTKISNDNGIKCYEWLDKEIKDENLDETWTGFLHNALTYPSEYPNKYENKTMPLCELVKNKYFNLKLKNCLGIFVFTEEVKKFLISKN